MIRTGGAWLFLVCAGSFLVFSVTGMLGEVWGARCRALVRDLLGRLIHLGLERLGDGGDWGWR